MNLTLNPKKAFFIMLGVFVLIILGVGGAFYVINGMLQTRASKVSDLKAEVDILDLRIENSRDAARDFEEFKDIEGVLDSVLPPEKIQNDIIAEILDLSARNSATVGSITFPSSGSGAATDKLDFNKSQTVELTDISGVRALEIQLAVTATFNNTLSLLEDFEKNQRKMQVVDISLVPLLDEEQNPTGEFTISLSINAYQRG